MTPPPAGCCRSRQRGLFLDLRGGSRRGGGAGRAARWRGARPSSRSSPPRPVSRGPGVVPGRARGSPLRLAREAVPRPGDGPPAGSPRRRAQAGGWQDPAIAGRGRIPIQGLEGLNRVPEGQPGSDGDFFLAMAYWQTGDKSRPRACYALADLWGASGSTHESGLVPRSRDAAGHQDRGRRPARDRGWAGRRMPGPGRTPRRPRSRGSSPSSPTAPSCAGRWWRSPSSWAGGSVRARPSRRTSGPSNTWQLLAERPGGSTTA